MSHNNDPFNDAPEPARFEPSPVDDHQPSTPTAGEPISLPRPEPLLAAEPPPWGGAHLPAAGAGADGGPSWRTLVMSSSGEDVSDRFGGAHTGEVPTSGGAPPGPSPAADTTIGTLGDEPMGGVPRDQPGNALQNPAPAPEPRTEHRSSWTTVSRVGEELFAWLKTLASAAVYATLIVTFGFQVARVEGQSMAPTLEDQDRLIVNKLAYRIGQPQVGDIVMLYYPLNPDKSFVKRVIAEEGDQIRIVDGRVYRNDVPIHDDYVPEMFRSHDDYGPEVVPQGYYFVMGDHRNNSSDSRHWKFVPKKYIIGKVQVRWWPIPAARIF
jgi:signal peptidase I